METLFFSLVIVGCAYLVGAIPTGYLLARIAGIADIRAHGSGNIGATNVSRILGLKYFFLVFFIDGAKAFLFLKLLAFFGVSDVCRAIAACVVLLGNGFSLFLHFSGGKGVATAVGIFAAFSPLLVLLVFIPWGILLLFTKTMGVASVGAALSLPFFSLLMCEGGLIFFLAIFVALWVLLRHTRNMRDYFLSKKRA
jgi:glycerol-3-phosphate acyltransferase PlsY